MISSDLGLKKELVLLTPVVLIVLLGLYNSKKSLIKDLSLCSSLYLVLLSIRLSFWMLLSRYPFSEIWWASIWIVTYVTLFMLMGNVIGKIHFKSRLKTVNHFKNELLEAAVDMTNDYNEGHT